MITLKEANTKTYKGKEFARIGIERIHPHELTQWKPIFICTWVEAKHAYTIGGSNYKRISRIELVWFRLQIFVYLLTDPT